MRRRASRRVSDVVWGGFEPPGARSLPPPKSANDDAETHQTGLSTAAGPGPASLCPTAPASTGHRTYAHPEDVATARRRDARRHRQQRRSPRPCSGNAPRLLLRRFQPRLARVQFTTNGTMASVYCPLVPTPIQEATAEPVGFPFKSKLLKYWCIGYLVKNVPVQAH